jgi:hypothetical protein
MTYLYISLVPWWTQIGKKKHVGFVGCPSSTCRFALPFFFRSAPPLGSDTGSGGGWSGGGRRSSRAALAAKKTTWSARRTWEASTMAWVAYKSELL